MLQQLDARMQKENNSVRIHSLVEELLVEEEDEQIDVDFGFIKHLHHGDLLVLQLQQILHTNTGYSSGVHRARSQHLPQENLT